jgi:hypothetical protein
MKKQLFLLLLLGISYYFYSKKATDSLIIISALILYIIIFHLNEINEIKEHIDGTIGVSTNEAIQNLASMYNSGTLKATNLELVGDLKVGGKTVLSGNVTLDGATQVKNANITGDLTVGGKTTMNSNLILNENLKMQDKKILSLGDIGMAYSNWKNKRGEGHFVMFRGSDGHNILTQQVSIGDWALLNPRGKIYDKPWGNPSQIIYEGNANDDLKIAKNTDLFP